MIQSRPDKVLARRKEPHTVIIARGERIRHFTVRPWMPFAGAASVGAVLLGVALAGSTFLAQGRLSEASIAGDTGMRQSYEERIAALRAELDRVTSKQLLGQELVEKKVSELLRRQAELAERHDMIEPIAKRADTDDVPPPTPRPDNRVDAGDLDLRLGADAAPKKMAYAEEDSHRVPWPLRGGPDTAAAATDPLDTVGQSLRLIASEQVDRIGQMTETAYEASGAISRALHRVGMGGKGAEEDVGGPYLPTDGAATFETRVQDLDNALAQLESLKKEARELPLRNPAPGRVVTSPFGVRDDPMLDTPAFHSGMDFRAAYGSPVRATAAGKVVRAGWAGGYGRMIEIDNGNGITTRFGHLSKILVAPGDSVATGTLIGKSGSSGRSTGPHLHYEIRRDGRPINPVTFLTAGRQIDRYL